MKVCTHLLMSHTAAAHAMPALPTEKEKLLTSGTQWLHALWDLKYSRTQVLPHWQNEALFLSQKQLNQNEKSDKVKD